MEEVAEPTVESFIVIPKPSEPVPDIYQYVPTEPTIISPYVEVIDTKQKEIDELKELVKQLMAERKIE